MTGHGRSRNHSYKKGRRDLSLKQSSPEFSDVKHHDDCMSSFVNIQELGVEAGSDVRLDFLLYL